MDSGGVWSLRMFTVHLGRIKTLNMKFPYCQWMNHPSVCVVCHILIVLANTILVRSSSGLLTAQGFVDSSITCMMGIYSCISLCKADYCWLPERFVGSHWFFWRKYLMVNLNNNELKKGRLIKYQNHLKMRLGINLIFKIYLVHLGNKQWQEHFQN